MKKIVVLLLPFVIMIACVTMTPPPIDWDYVIDDPYQNNVIKITVNQIYQHYEVFEGYKNLEGIGISIQNLGIEPIIINWNKTALEYNGISHRVFLSGQKYIDAKKDIPDQVIGGGSRIDTGIYPADSVYYISGQYGGWRMKGFNTSAISCLICIEIDEKEYFYIAKITNIVTTFTPPLPRSDVEAH